jgi:uncharacterized membrane protein YczE
LLLAIHSRLGASPWDTFQVGLAGKTGLTLGRVSQIVGAVIIIIDVAIGQVPGKATVLNMYFVGYFVDLIEKYSLIPNVDSLLGKVVMLLCGIFVVSWGTFFYINAGWGAGPRDSLMLGLSRLFSTKVWKARTALEVCVAMAGLALGARLGVGTVMLAVLVGPGVQIAYRIAGVDENGEGAKSLEYALQVTPIIKGYKVYRNNVLLTTVSSATLSYQDSLLSYETLYSYKVNAISSDDLESTDSNIINITTPEGDNTVLNGVSLPVLESLTEVNDDYLKLTWFSAAGAVKYNVYYSTVSNGDLTLLGNVTGMTYSDDINGGIPAQVENLSCEVLSSSRTLLAWDSASAPANSAHRYYRVAGVNGSAKPPPVNFACNFILSGANPMNLCRSFSPLPVSVLCTCEEVHISTLSPCTCATQFIGSNA